MSKKFSYRRDDKLEISKKCSKNKILIKRNKNIDKVKKEQNVLKFMSDFKNQWMNID